LKVGYDGNADDDIDDAGDDLVVSSPFGSTAITPSHDDNGNLTDDGTYKYTYDAWNRLVKATLNDTDITIQQAEFDGLGRRIKKTVTNSGDLDGTTVYLYNRHQIIETRNGSDEVTLQVYPGTRYIDEVVGLRVKDQGRLYAHQDANWNVTALTDLTGRVIEQYWYSPYGQLEAHVAAHPFDFDDDGDVDAQDIAAGTSGGTCWGDYDGASGDCKRLDADGDRDIDVDDYTIIINVRRRFLTTHPATAKPPCNASRQPATADAATCSRTRACHSMPNWHHTRTARGNMHQRRGRFMQRDPLITISRARSGYEDGLSLSEYVRSRPTIATDPTGLLCFCPFNPLNPAKGELTVDDSCSGKCPIWVIPEDKNKPAYTPAESGKTVPADGFVLEDGTVYKIDGSTCVTISDAGGGTIKISTCVNFCARLAGKGKAHPVPPGTFSNEPPQGAAPSPSD
jgi:YD repeat-containing protein